MLWFKHFSDARRNPKLLKIERKMPEVGYARYFRLLEVIAERGGKGKDFQPELDLNGTAIDLDWLAAELNVDAEELRTTLDLFAGVGLIDEGCWQGSVVAIPAMVEYKDEYTARRQKKGDSPSYSPSEKESKSKSKSKENGECPDTIGTISEHQSKEVTDVTDILKLDGQIWKALGISTLPDGFQNFIALTERTQPQSGEVIATWGNRVMKAAKAKSVLYPRVFLKVIADLERKRDARPAMTLRPGSMQDQIEAERRRRTTL